MGAGDSQRPEPELWEGKLGRSIASIVSGHAVAHKEVLRFDDLFREHASRVHRMVASLLGPGASDADVQDLAQEVFLTVHRSLERFRGESKVETWLYGIASRVVLTQLRGWRRHRRLCAAVEAEPVLLAGTDIELQSAQREELRRIWRCLMKIRPEKRVVFLLSEVEERSGKEIAELLQINEATVRTRLYHARRELMELREKAERRDAKEKK